MTSGHFFYLRLSFILLTAIILESAALTARAQSSTIQAQFPYSSSAAVEIDPSTGTANYSIPLRVPPGRGAVSPEFALTYNSSQGNGIFGVGWNHTIGYVERSTKHGVPRYDGTDTYQMVLAGSSVELVYDAATGRYYPETDGGFQRIRQTGGHWELTDTSGTVFLFGQTSAARIYDPEDIHKVFRWSLERVRDVSGNEMVLTYTRDGQWLYPDEIRYTANAAAGLDHYAVIAFELQAGHRSDPQLSYHPGFAVRLRKRVAAIRVTADGHPYARYDLHYDMSPNTRRSLLAQVDLDRDEGANPVPPVRFSYQSQRGFSRDTAWSIPSGMEFYSEIEYVVMPGQTESFLYHDRGVRQADINSDGWMDLIRSVQGGTRKVHINNGDYTYTNDPAMYPAGAPPLVEPSANFPLDTGVRFVDVNGDGRLDMVQHREVLQVPQGQSRERRVFLGQADGWSADQSQWYLPAETPLMQKICSLQCFQYYVGTMLVDIDNDGRVDIVRSHMESDTHVVYRNNGNGWTKDAAWQLPPLEYTDLSDGATLADLNGDRLPDIFYLKGNVARVFMNEGDGWFEDSTSPWAQAYPFYDIEAGSTQLADVNGDGLADLVHGRKVSTGGLTGATYDKEVRINTGSGWREDPAYNVDAIDFRMKGTRLFDADGDGLTDFMTNISTDPRKLYLNSGRSPDLLVGVDNGLGGTRTIEYVPSTDFVQDFMPFARPVVRRMTHALAHTAEAYVTEFEYHDGVYSGAERSFQGFGMVVTKDAHGNAVETLYHTDPVKQGRPIEQRIYDSSDILFGKTTYEWDVKPIVAGSDYVYLKRTDNFVYDGDLDGRRTAEEHMYSEHIPGVWLVDQTVQYGEVDFDSGDDIGTDRRSVHHEYVSNTTDWLIGLPSKTWTFDDQGQYADYSEFIYDGTAAAGEEPTLGRLTTRRDWHSDLATYGFQVPTHYQYSACGNLIKTVDNYGAESRMTYDPDHEVFPLVTENDKDHAVTRTYFGINGEGLVSADGLSGRWGQLKSTTDPNARTGRQDHDDMGRTAAQISPLDSVSYPTQMSDVVYTATHIRHHVAVRQRHGEAGTIDSVDFYDALGRKIQTKSVSGEPGRFIVSQQVEYNERGLPVKAYLPFYTTNDLHTIDPIDPDAPHVLTEYDAMGRVVRVTQPDGVTFTNVEYDDWTTTAYDENGHMQKSFFDAFGRLVRKEVYTGADGRSADYPAAAYELYTAAEYEYDALGNLTETRADADGVAVVTRIGYDTMSRKTWIEDPDMGRWEYTYDNNGNLKTQTDAFGKVITFDYDGLNRLIRKSFSDGSGDVVYEYDDDVLGGEDGVGRLTNISYPTGATRFHYDALGRERQSTKTIDILNHDVSRTYDALNNLTELRYPHGLPVEYSYNSAGQVTMIAQGDAGLLYGDVNGDGVISSIDASITARIVVGFIVPTHEQAQRADVNASGEVTSIDASLIARYTVQIISEFIVERHVQTFVSDVRYNVFGQMTYVAMGNGTRTYYLFDALTQRLAHKKTFSADVDPQEDGAGWALAGGDLQDLSYTYDAAGNIRRITDSVHTASQTFTYDHLNRLKSADNPGRYGLIVYDYDVLGNITEKGGVTYTYNANCGGGPHAVCETYDPVAQKSTVYAYDANGNMEAKQVFLMGVSQGLTEFEYDMENRLRRIRKDGMVKATYEYDGDGGRTRKIVDGATTEFIGSLYEINQEGASRHIYLGSQRIATARDDRFYYYHADHLGGLNVATDRNGAVREIREYRPFGAASFSHVNYDTAADQGHFYFTQHYEDPESGLIFMQARYYDPSLGKFITADLLVPRPSNPQEFNRYSYSGNNPVNYTDPSGHGWFKKFFGKIASAIVGIAAFIGSGFNPVVGMQAYSITDSVISGTQAIVKGANPLRILGSIGAGLAIGLGTADIIGGIANLGVRVGAYAAQGATIGVAGAAITQGDIGLGAAFGAGAGAAMGFLSSQQITNYRNHGKFMTDKNFAKLNQRISDLAQMAGIAGDANHTFELISSTGDLSSGIAAGHTGISVDGDAFGFYPEPGQGELGWLFGKSGPGQIRAESAQFIRQSAYNLGMIGSRINGFQANVAMMQKYNPGTFSLATNCSRFALDSARMIGINVPSNLTTFGQTNPAKVAAWSRSIRAWSADK